MIAFTRQWAMPSADTFDVPPIGDFVKKYLRQSKVSVDPFARNKRWATYTNDLNPDTAAEYHLEAIEFVKQLRSRGVMCDLVIFDPPYSPTQIKQMYESIGDGKYFGGQENWLELRNELRAMVTVGGIVLSFGWNSQGMGDGRGFEIVELLLCAHGAAHNDTICMAERKVAEQGELFVMQPQVVEATVT